MTRTVSAMAFGLLLGPAPLYAMPVSYGISTPDTAIGLSWHAFGGTLQAHLAGVTGELTLDMDNDMDDRLSVSIPVATLAASNNLLTWQMKSSLFFDADRYPAIRFTSSRVVALGGGHFRVFGYLGVKNILRPVILEATLQEPTGTPAGREGLSLHATTAISRAAFNMASMAALVGDTVTIDIAIEAKVRHRA
ncbi:YceI family protein [Raoultella sp. WB_B2P2-3]|uniref:YceI family protein n=1 Tax=Raoultella scottii TaxID=3040937 RepID=UPI002F91F258